MQRCYKAAQSASGVFNLTVPSTYHLNLGLNLFGAIDHIRTIGPARLANDQVVIRPRFNGEWPTDHYPIVADYVLSHRSR